MKTFIFIAFLSGLIGASAAWAINQSRYGYREALFGPFDMAGTVTSENVAEVLDKREKKKVGKVVIDDDLDYDFGVMSPGQEGEKTFRIRNEGEGPLKLRVGASTCKCTLGALNKEILEPGEETEIKLTWTVKGGSTDFGQSAQLLTDDPKSVAITLKISGKVIQDFQLVPDVWTFGEIATGDSFEITGDIYNYTGTTIETTDLKFTSDSMTELADIEVQPLDKADYMEGGEAAVQAFRVVAKIKPGMKQGDISQNLLVGFNNIGDPAKADDGDETVSTEEDTAEASGRYITVPVKGRLVGPLRMLESSKLTMWAGEYLYDFGRIGPDGELKAKTFVVLKGDERDNTTLTVGETRPGGVVRAVLGEPKSRGSMVLYPLEIELVPSDETISRLGKDSRDYGSIWIKSDNPKVSSMRVVLKFAIEGR
ncbi:hypothetical protein Poly51_24280 [Rubripirellula tenax]|uniref:DUF1573 domain-containing protein n=1 Tax=Rubripirellula tenax TaxID=2528015 RepID=A0A5C6F7T2_9BACT|nr:DUF1573 domain-containing protein [Rubripirellula tenax]TWU56517.1 hypothetical protein Poly51_24280 [Rubripirellula tenax]